jgi:magnesium transporter
MMEDYPDLAARLLERAGPADAAALLASVSTPVAAGVFRAMGPAAAAECCAVLSNESLGEILAELPLDVSARALRRVDAARRETVMLRLPDDDRVPLRRLLSYPDDSAGALADPLALALPEDISVADAQKELRAAGRASHVFFYMYVVARDQRVVGVLTIPELMSARGGEPLSSVMTSPVASLDAYADLATVAAHPAWRDFDALPVVDSAGRLLGAIRHKAVRRMNDQATRSVVDTLVGLSEVYWAGLSGVLTSISTNRESRIGARPRDPSRELRDGQPEEEEHGS